MQNRVTPKGDIINSEFRGNWMGNRGGQLHRNDKTLTARRWVTKSWICCRLHFKNRHREVMAPGRYTELFFLDEVTAFAAGHRPCAECRRQHFINFIHHWSLVTGKNRRYYVSEIDSVLHQERIDRQKRKVTFQAQADELPDGSFVLYDGTAWLILNNHMVEWQPEGYISKSPIRSGQNLVVLTPRSIVELLKAGYSAEIHQSATLF